jgi:hypothetical protein
LAKAPIDYNSRQEWAKAAFLLMGINQPKYQPKWVKVVLLSIENITLLSLIYEFPPTSVGGLKNHTTLPGFSQIF